jgi:hypothetical protein
VKRIRDFVASIPPYGLDPSAWKGKGWTDLGPQSIQSRPAFVIVVYSKHNMQMQ